MMTMEPDVLLRNHLRNRMKRLRRLGEDVIAELALTIYWADPQRDRSGGHRGGVAMAGGRGACRD
jgi:hypothetical protein